MKKSGVLAARAHRLIAAIHPHNPPTAKESQQILSVLQTSFKKRLDDQYPPPRKPSSKSSILYDIPTCHANSSSQATSDYFGSLLNHPILSQSNERFTKKDALSRFDQLMAESRVDLNHLTEIMRQHMREITPVSNLSGRLDTWLQLTDKASREAFFTTKPALRTAVDIVTKENHEGLLWKWLEVVYARTLVSGNLTSRDWLGVEDFLVSRLMRFAIQRHNLSEATEQFIQACRYRGSSARGNPSLYDTKPGLPSAPMSISAKRLTSAIIFHRSRHDISADSFDQMLRYVAAWTPDPTASGAFCALYHPTRPSGDPLYDFLRQNSTAEVLTKVQKNARPGNRRAVMTAILDASKISLAVGKRPQASFLLNFAIDQYPEYLPPRKVDADEPQLETFLFAPG